MISRVVTACRALAVPALLAIAWTTLWLGGFPGVVAWHGLVDIGPALGAVGLGGWAWSWSRRRSGTGARSEHARAPPSRSP